MFSLGLGTLKVGLKLEIDDFKSGIAAVRKTLNGLGTMAGAAAVGGLAAIGGAAVAATRSFADFEHRVRSAASVSSDSMNAYTHFLHGAINASLDVEHTANAMADGLFFLSTAGWNAADSLKALSHMGDLATASNTALNEVANLTTNIMSGFAYKIDELGRVNNVLVRGFTNSNTTLSSLAKTMEYVAPVAASFGQDITTVVALTGRLGDAGLAGEKAGTALRAMFVRLAKPMKTTKAAMEELSISLAKGPNEYNNLIDVIGQLEVAQTKLTKTRFDEQVARVFGAEALPAVLALLKQGSKDLKDFEKLLKDSEVTTESVANSMRSSLSNQLGILSGRLNVAALRAGQVFAPAVSVASKYIGGFTKEIVGNKESFRKLQNMVADGIDAFKSMVTVMVSVTKVGAYVAIVVEKIISGLSLLKSTVQIAAMGLGMAWLKIENIMGNLSDMDFERARDANFEDFKVLRRSMEEVADSTEAFTEKTLRFIDGLDGLGVSVKKVMGDASDAVRETTHDSFNALGAAALLADGLNKPRSPGDDPGNMKKAARDIHSNLMNGVRDLKLTLLEAADSFMGAMTDAFGTSLSNAMLLGETLRRAMSGDSQGASLTASTLKKRAASIMGGDDWKKLNKQASERLGEWRVAEIERITQETYAREAARFGNAMKDVGTMLGNALDQISVGLGKKGGLDGLGDTLASAARLAGPELARGANRLFESLFDDVQGIFSSAQNAISTMFDGGADGGGGLASGLFAGLAEAAANATSPAAAVTAGLKALGASLLQTAMETEKGQAMLWSFGDKITDIFGDSFVVDLLGAFDGVLGVFHTIAAVFKPIEGFKGIFDKVGRVLFIYAKALGLQMMAFAEVFLVLKLVFISIPKIIIDAVVGLVDLLNKSLAKLPGIGDDAIKADGLRKAQDSLTAAFQDSKEQVVDMAKGMKDLATLSYDEAKESAIRAQEEAKAARNMKELNDELKNAPSGFKIARARFGASDGAMTMPGRNVGSEGGGNTINIYGVNDAGSVIDELSRRLVVRKGTRYTATFHASDAFPRLSLVG